MTVNILSVILLKAYYKNYLKPSVNAQMTITNFQDFSRPENNHFTIPGLFQVFHNRTNPEQSFS